MVDSSCGRAGALLVRNADVPVYVAYGQAQLGMVGDDVLREHPMAVAMKRSSPTVVRLICLPIASWPASSSTAPGHF